MVNLPSLLNLPRGKYEYKFTRGNWMKVETSEENNYIGNRVDRGKAANRRSVMIRIVNWLDLGARASLELFHLLFFRLRVPGCRVVFAGISYSEKRFCQVQCVRRTSTRYLFFY